jgi:hypothetical protein
MFSSPVGIAVLALLSFHAAAFTSIPVFRSRGACAFLSNLHTGTQSSVALRMAEDGADVNFTEIGYEDINEDDDEIAPGMMRVSEIKAELRMRGVGSSDCFDKDSLAKRLEEARATGKADPSILDAFNKKKLEDTLNGENENNSSNMKEVSDDAINAALGADGNLPGGMSPDQLKLLMGNPELMALLQNTKMQDVMKLMMTEGPEEFTKVMEEDEEIKMLVIKLNKIIGTSQ